MDSMLLSSSPFKTLLRLCCSSRRAFTLIVLAGMLNGASTAILIANVTKAAGLGVLPGGAGLLLRFVMLCAAKLGTEFISELLLTRMVEAGIFELRMHLTRKVLGTPLATLEKIGPARVLAALTEDVNVMTATLRAVPALCLDISILILCLAYLGSLSVPLLIGLGVCTAVGVLIYRLLQSFSVASLQKARDLAYDLFRNFRLLCEGIKELKVYRSYRYRFASKNLVGTATNVREANVKGILFSNLGSVWGQFVLFFFIGLALFSPMVSRTNSHVVLGYTLTILYISGPINSIVAFIPNVTRYRIAHQKLESLGLAPHDMGSLTISGVTTRRRSWHGIELAGIQYSYRVEGDDRTFTVGPLNLAFRPGEIVFFIGGNGSGKTTLAKLIAGLYSPDAGEIRIDDVPVDDQNRQEYSSRFGVIFSDFCLFQDLVELNTDEMQDKVRKYLTFLQLQDKVRVQNGRLLAQELSQGQRKRLALLLAYLQDRDIYIFDEWAADQDPYFKEAFYCPILSQLKAEGKTVLAITHDDHYYFAADRIIRMESGQIERRSAGTEESARFAPVVG